MSDIQHDPEFCGIAAGYGRLQGGRAQVNRTERSELYGVALRPGGMLGNSGRFW